MGIVLCVNLGFMVIIVIVYVFLIVEKMCVIWSKVIVLVVIMDGKEYYVL